MHFKFTGRSGFVILSFSCMSFKYLLLLYLIGVIYCGCK